MSIRLVGVTVLEVNQSAAMSVRAVQYLSNLSPNGSYRKAHGKPLRVYTKGEVVLTECGIPDENINLQR